jgi:hypothetical protein
MNIVKSYVNVDEIPANTVLILSEGETVLDAWRNLSQFSKKVEKVKACHLAENEHIFVFKKNKYIDLIDRNKIFDSVMDLVPLDENIDISKEDRDDLEKRVLSWLEKVLGDSYSVGGLIGYI